MKLHADFGKIANLPFFLLHHVANLFRILQDNFSERSGKTALKSWNNRTLLTRLGGTDFAIFASNFWNFKRFQPVFQLIAKGAFGNQQLRTCRQQWLGAIGWTSI